MVGPLANEMLEAARILRDHATSCEQGDWKVEECAPGMGYAWVNLPAYHHAWGMHGFVDEARYVALMQPSIALLLADLLEDEAQWADVGADHDSGAVDPDRNPVQRLTRAVLASAAVPASSAPAMRTS